MNNKQKNKIIGKISLLTFGNSNNNGTLLSSSNIKNNNNNNKIKFISEPKNPAFHRRSRSSYKYKNISSNNSNNLNLENIITNIPNPNTNTILNNNKNTINNSNTINNTNNINNANNTNIVNNENQNPNQVYKQYQTTTSFSNVNDSIKRFRSLSPNINKNNKKYLLPKKNSNKKTLVLDLDETLVHSCGVPFNCPSDFIIQIEQDNDIHDIHVLVRPHVEEFLEKMSKRYELVIFTASISKYANPLLNIIDKMGFVPFRLFREHCTLINTTFVKDLNLLGRQLKDIIILDNNPTAYSLNHYNGFPIKSWFDDKNDDELLKIIPILEFLSYVPDVRDYIKKIVSQNKVQFDLVKQVIINYNNNLKKNSIPPECRGIYNLFKDDNNEKMLQKSKSSKLSIINSACNNGYKYNNNKNKINNYTNINIINNNLKHNKIFSSDNYNNNNNNSYLIEQKGNQIKNINVRVVKNRLTGKRIIKKKDILSKNVFLKRKKVVTNTMRYNFSNNKIINNKNNNINNNWSSNCIINNINNININITNNCNGNKSNITENIKQINNSGSCVKHRRIYFNNNFNTKRKISANASETRNNKLNIQGNSKEISLHNNGAKLNKSQKTKPKTKYKNKIQLINVGGGLKIDIKFLREQFKVYLKDYKRENHNKEKILRQLYKNKNINISHSQKIEN